MQSFLLLVLLALIEGVFSAQGDRDWPQFGGNANHARFLSGDLPINKTACGLTTFLSVPTESSLQSSVAANGTLFYTDIKGLHAMVVSTHSDRWVHDGLTTGNVVLALITERKNLFVAYVNDSALRLFVIDTSDGRIVTQKAIPWTLGSRLAPPLALGSGLLILSLESQYMAVQVTLEGKKGDITTKWSITHTSKSVRAPLSVKKGTIAILKAGSLSLVDDQTGKEVESAAGLTENAELVFATQTLIAVSDERQGIYYKVGSLPKPTKNQYVPLAIGGGVIATFVYDKTSWLNNKTNSADASGVMLLAADTLLPKWPSLVSLGSGATAVSASIDNSLSQNWALYVVSASTKYGMHALRNNGTFLWQIKQATNALTGPILISDVSFYNSTFTILDSPTGYTIYTTPKCHGTCADGFCSCKKNFAGPSCMNWCSNATKCNHRGYCDYDGECICDQYYYGERCLRHCDSRPEVGNCKHGFCNVSLAMKSAPMCQCNEANWFGEYCDVNCVAAVNCSGKGNCINATGKCSCSSSSMFDFYPPGGKQCLPTLNYFLLAASILVVYLVLLCGGMCVCCCIQKYSTKDGPNRKKGHYHAKGHGHGHDDIS